MKKHPVDDLFKNKLSTIERQPSSSAWNRIQQGQSKKERAFPIWVWYVAAGVALLLVAGYSFLVNPANVVRPEIAKVETKTDKEIVRKKTDPLKGEIRKSEDSSLPETIERQRHPLTETASISVPIRTVDVEKDQPAPRKPVKESEEGIANRESHSIAVSPAETPAAIAIIETQKIPEDQPAASLQTENVKDRTIVMNVTSEDDSLVQPKVSRFTRVFRQLKNARAGERVNWDEVGFNPKAVLARVDGKRKQ